MATWITHFRIAERLIDLGLPVCKEEFVVEILVQIVEFIVREQDSFLQRK